MVKYNIVVRFFQSLDERINFIIHANKRSAKQRLLVEGNAALEGGAISVLNDAGRVVARVRGGSNDERIEI